MEAIVPEASASTSLQDLADQISELAGHLNAADRRWLMLIAEFDRREGWAAHGARSCAHWLNWKCGLDLGAAREKLRVAQALEGLPQIGAAMGRGELSYSKVRALTRVASPATEASLLMIALHGTADHVERVVRQYRRAREAEELSREARQQAGRCLSYLHDDDGSLVFKGRLPAEVGALFLKAIDAVVRQVEDEARAELSRRGAGAPDQSGTRRTSAAAENVPAETLSTTRVPLAHRRADALGVLAESFLAHGLEALSGGDRQQIVVHVDAVALTADAPGSCTLEDGPALAAETARRLACDASVVTIIEDADANPLDVGRRTRSIPPALKRALKSRDQGCRFPGCTHRKYVDGHHVHHWAQGGETKLGNLISLCRFHHRLVHEGGVEIEVRAEGRWRFRLPDGTGLDSAPTLANLSAGDLPFGDDAQLHDSSNRAPGIVAANAARSIHITPQTAVTHWRGESMDYGLALDVLCGQEQRGRSDSAATCRDRRI